MRSSIACLRCRRSKIKCDNDGGNSPCESCIKAGLQCQYPDNVSGHSKRNEPGGGSKQDRESGHERKRLKKGEDSAEYQRVTATAAEILASPFLSSQMWDQLFALYKLHFASELLFLHIPTLKERMSEKERNADLDLVLLGVLTLTSRFHTDLATYIMHSPAVRSSIPKVRSKTDTHYASDFFANLLLSALGSLRVTISMASIERVQAFLMLGYYEWTISSPDNSLASWMYVGTAIRLAQGLKLGIEEERPAPPDERVEILHDPVTGRRTSTSDLAVTREVRRRTMFSCFLVDRMLACASGREAMIDPEKLDIQLPCTDMALDLARDVYTGTLRQKPNNLYRSITDDSVLSHFIQLIDIWGDIAKYSVGGGKMLEKDPLWYNGTAFRDLADRLDNFSRNLPETFHLSRQNFFRHDNHQAGSSYVALHMLISLCRICLHRENIPFFPARCGRPGGPSPFPPLPISPLTQHPPPPALWSDSTEKAFIGGRDVLDLVELCGDKLPISPLIFFAILSAAFMSVYGYHFPQLDERQLLSETRNLGRGKAFETNHHTSLAVQTLEKMIPLLPSVSNAVTVLKELDAYFTKAWAMVWEYERAERDGRRPSFGLVPAPPASERENIGNDPLSIERERASISSNTDPTRSSISESSHKPRGSISELGAPRFMPESNAGPREHSHHRSMPSGSFTAANEGNRPVSAASETSSRNHLGRLSDNTQYPNWRSPIWGASFSVEQIPQLESWRIGVVLNDLQAFSGVGVLGDP